MAISPVLELNTERLFLRRWHPSDRARFAAINADPQVMEYFPALLDRAASDALADRMDAEFLKRGWGFWAVEAPGVDAFIGVVGLSVPASPLPFGPCVEIGWRLARHHWGKGYASEAARAVLRAGFERLGLQEIVSFTVPANRRSRAVMERIGLRWNGETFDHPRLPEGHPLRPHVLYRILRQQWRVRPA